MDFALVVPWIVGANAAATLLQTGYMLLSTRATKALKAIEDLREDIAALVEERQRAGDATVARFQLVETRLLKLESDLEHMPDRDQAHRLELAIEKLNGCMSTLDQRLSGRIDALNERLQPVQSIATRLQELEFERGS